MRSNFSPVSHPHARRMVWLVVMALLILLVSRRVEAQVEQVYTKGPVTVLTGPDWGAPVVDQWPGGVPIILSGCLQDRSWCQVNWGPEEGWVASSGLVASVNGNSMVFSNWTWPVPLVIFEGGRVYGHPWPPRGGGSRPVRPPSGDHDGRQGSEHGPPPAHEDHPSPHGNSPSSRGNNGQTGH